MPSLKFLITTVALYTAISHGVPTLKWHGNFKRIIGLNGCCPENYGQPCIKYPGANATGVNGTCEAEPDGIDTPYCKGIYNDDGCSLETLGQPCVNFEGMNSSCIIAPDPWDTVYACAEPGEERK